MMKQIRENAHKKLLDKLRKYRKLSAMHQGYGAEIGYLNLMTITNKRRLKILKNELKKGII